MFFGYHTLTDMLQSKYQLRNLKLLKHPDVFQKIFSGCLPNFFLNLEFLKNI